MTAAWHFIAALILISMAAGLALIARGPTAGDRLLAVQLAGTAGVAILLILAAATGVSALLDIALVYALLSSGLLIAFVKVHLPPGPAERRRP